MPPIGTGMLDHTWRAMSAADGTTWAGRWERVAARAPSWFGGFFGLLGAACAVAALINPLRWLLEPLLRLISDWLVPASPNLAYAVFLLLLAGALVARKRVAWWALTCYTLLLLAIEVLALIAFDAMDVVPPLVVTAVVLTLLVATRSQFSARVRRGAFWRALGANVETIQVEDLGTLNVETVAAMVNLRGFRQQGESIVFTSRHEH